MSKKKKDKFRKQIKAQILEQMARAEATPTTTASISSPAPMTKSDLPMAKPVQVVTADNTVIQNLPQIKYDLKKTGIVVFSLVILMAGLIYFDSKYGILLQFGNHLFKILNIN